jgi:hypothetical protein
LTKQDIGLMDDTEVLAWHRNNRPLKLNRLDWQEHPLLVKRRTITPPPVATLPPVTEEELRTNGARIPTPPVDDDAALINPEEIGTRRPRSSVPPTRTIDPS